MTSRLPHFYDLPPAERRQVLASQAGFTPEEVAALESGLSLDQGNRMIENVVGLYSLPMGIATNFVINGRDVLVPMVVEEPSVVAGASKAARAVRDSGGFQVETTDSLMIGQIQVLGVPDLAAAKQAVLAKRQEILDQANARDPLLVSLGGGSKDLEVRIIEDSPVGPMLVLHLICDALDAMGANAVNTAVESVSPLVEQLTGGKTNLRIISNLADKRLVRARARIHPEHLTVGSWQGPTVVRRIVEAYALAAVDPYRAATHNKGIMNGVDAVVMATGNDWRAVEAGAHAYAARSGAYRPLTQWQADEQGNLVGTLEMPMAVGIVGGATRVHPLAKLSLKLMGVTHARDLAQVLGAVGLAQNLAALWALATEGIQRGHMELHARQVAIAAGAQGDEIDTVSKRMSEEHQVRVDAAERILIELRGSSQTTEH
ncbi:MAG: hydroxymethylglutaryl-CoA reductase, degradative [Anaerolineae bacterium]